MSAWQIREAGEADLPALAGLFAAHLAEQGTWNPLYPDTRNPDFDGLSFLKRAWAAGVEQFRVAEEAGRLLGFIRFSLSRGGAPQSPRGRRGPRSFGGRRLLRLAATALRDLAERWPEPSQLGRDPVSGYGYIADLYLLPERRREGIGSQLLDSALQWFRQQHADLIYLHVFDLNRTGVQFWSQLGFLPYRRILLRQLRS